MVIKDVPVFMEKDKIVYVHKIKYKEVEKIKQVPLNFEKLLLPVVALALSAIKNNNLLIIERHLSTAR